MRQEIRALAEALQQVRFEHQRDRENAEHERENLLLRWKIPYSNLSDVYRQGSLLMELKQRRSEIFSLLLCFSGEGCYLMLIQQY
ncbi:MAG: hypothetical protein JO316_16145 [Abitibacteriaceae bacterium]|nr:hypothetical protein [Abditibacteriaceae bacterium]MBV9866884.1 hypothetical protein [Abditibacteriaceae bacterium]